MVLNYCDRQLIALLKPTLGRELAWSERDYGNMIFAFQAAYAGGYLLFGGVVDRIGARAGYAVAFMVWTVAQVLHGFSRSVGDFIWARALLGAGEGGAYPSSLSMIAAHFEPDEKAWVTGLVNSGVNIGALVTPLLLPVIVTAWGWRAAFVVTGVASLGWLVVWFVATRAPTGPMAQPVDRPAGQPLSVLLRAPPLWAYAAAKFLIDPIWWLYLFWLPDYLSKSHGVHLATVGWPLFAIFLAADVGNIFGGWLSSALVKAGAPVGLARKAALLLFAVLPIPITLLAGVHSLWLAVAILGLAAAAHQGFSVNLFTIPSDLFSKGSVGTVIGIGGAVGAVGGMLMSQLVGYTLQQTGSYTVIFVVAAFMYSTALLFIHMSTRQYRLIVD
jgi:ACS family hexuronate transporter-like MFS transporter